MSEVKKEIHTKICEIDDLSYFTEKLEEAKKNNDIEKIRRYTNKINSINEPLIQVKGV